jgi:uncharacterized membrane protein
MVELLVAYLCCNQVATLVATLVAKYVSIHTDLAAKNEKRPQH